MQEIDPDTLELLERQLAERITERVRPALFKFYATVGAAVLGALGLFGWNVISDAPDQVANKIAASIEARISDATEQTYRVKAAASEAEHLMEDLRTKLEQLEPLTSSVDETINKISDLRTEAQNTTDLYERHIKPRLGEILALNEQLGVLAKEMEAIQTKLDIENDSPPRQEAIKQVIDSTAEFSVRAQQAEAQTTVFFQYAGGSEGQAREVASALKNAGYIVPGLDRESDAVYRHEVRYFHSQDEGQANRLAEETTQLLRDAGYEVAEIADISVNSFVEYRAKKPRIGVLELWLGLPSCKAFAAYSAEQWANEFLLPTQVGTWHVFVETLPIGVSLAQAEMRKQELNARFQQHQFAVIPTAGSQGNERYAIVIAKGLRDAGLARDLATYANECSKAHGAYAFQQTQ
jgi:hypothetical protein